MTGCSSMFRRKTSGERAVKRPMSQRPSDSGYSTSMATIDWFSGSQRTRLSGRSWPAKKGGGPGWDRTSELPRVKRTWRLIGIALEESCRVLAT
jgi:hypothetical protein